MPGLKTEICERLGIEYPVFQAGMGFVARGALAGAVSEAGGLGVIGAGSNMTRDEIKAEIDAVRAITDKPFGVDILFATVRAEGDVAAKYTEAVQEMVDVVIEEKVPVLISGLGSPKDAVPAAHAAGIYVISVCGAVRHAEKAVADGVDAVIASGVDGGGHLLGPGLEGLGAQLQLKVIRATALAAVADHVEVAPHVEGRHGHHPRLCDREVNQRGAVELRCGSAVGVGDDWRASMKAPGEGHETEGEQEQPHGHTLRKTETERLFLGYGAHRTWRPSCDSRF